MGIDNIRRWPLYIILAIGIMLMLSLLNSWSMETELRLRISEISTQLKECTQLQSSCTEESMTLLEQRDKYALKIGNLDKEKVKLNNDIKEYKDKITKSDSKINHTLVDVELCKTELQSLKNLQVSKSSMLETLRLEKATLTSQLTDKKQKIEELEREIEKIKSAMTTKSSPKPVAPSVITPSAQLPRLSPVLNAPLDLPAFEDAAKEEVEDSQMNEPEPSIM